MISESEHARRLERRLSIITYLSQSIFRRNTVEDVLWDIVSNCIERLGFEDCVIYLIDADRNVLVQKAAFGTKNLDDQTVIDPIEIPLGSGIVGAVAKSGQPEMVPDTHDDPRYIVDDSARRSELAVPIFAEGKLIGVIDSEHPEPDFYDDFHLDTLRDIAAISGIKISRTQIEKEREDFAQFAFENPNPVFRMDAAFAVSLANPPAQKILESFDKLPLIQRYQTLYQHVSSALVSHESKRVTLEVDGATYSVDIIPFEGRRYINLYFVDVTESHNARRAAEHADHTKTEFMSMMSHEIRTPLNGILNLSRLLRDTVDSARAIELLETMEYSGENLLTIINDILEFEKLGSGKVVFEQVSFNIRDVLSRQVQLLLPQSKEKSNKLRVKVETAVPRLVLGDATRLSQVISNLALNALKFTSNGTVSILASVISADADRTELLIKVVDDGVGIPYDKQANIFDLYEQAHAEQSSLFFGVGLGLGISRRLVEQQGGTISMDSVPNVGTTFSLRLPFGIGSEKSVKKETEPVSEADLSAARVLVVDDSAINILVAREFLEQWGVTVSTAVDGYKALELLGKQRVDLILMDLQMPGLTGYDTARRIRASKGRNRRVPILAMSADVLSATHDEIHGAGMDDQLVKPFHPKELHRKVGQLLSHSKSK